MNSKQHEAAVEQLNAEYQAFQNGTATVYNRFAQGVQQTGQGLNNVGVLMQQLGYQAGDFIVQVQSGTNAFVAFGQQATQLVGFLPMLAAEVGVAKVAFMGLNISMASLTLGLSIIIPLLTAAGALWMRTTESSDKATQSVDKQAQAYQNLINKLEELQIKRQMQVSGAQSQDEQITLNEINRLLEEQVVLQQRLSQLQSAGGRAAGYAQQKQDEADLIQAALDKNQIVIDGLVAERVETERINRLNQIRTNQILEGLAKSKRAAEDFRDVLVESLGVVTKISITDLSKPFTNALPAIQGMIDKLKQIPFVGQLYGQAVGQQNLLGRLTAGDDERGSQRATVAGANTRMPEQPWLNTGSSGGGGGAQTTTLENKMEEIYRYLELDKYLIEQETIAYEQRQDVLRSALDQKLITLQEYNELEKDLMFKHQQDLTNITLAGQQQNLTYAADFFGALAGVAAAGGDKMTKAVRVFSAAQALINSYLAYTQVIADPTLPWFAKIPAALGVLSAGLGMVNAIKGGGSSSGGGAGSTGGRGSATVVPTTAAAPTPQTVFIDSIDPKNLYSGETLINLFEALYDENDRRGKVFVVAR